MVWGEKRETYSGINVLLDLRRFERRSRRLLGAGYLFAAGVLAILALAWHSPPRAVRITEKPDYIIHADIIEGPAIPSDEPFRMVPPKFARRPGRPGVSAPSGLAPKSGAPPLPAWKEPIPPFEREIGRRVDRLSRGYTDTLTVDGGIPRGPGDRMPLRRDTGPDPGMFKADIIYNPENKTAAQGYVHIPLIRIGDLKQTEQYIRSLRGLTAGINSHTNITAVFDNPLPALKFYPETSPYVGIAEAIDERGISLDEILILRPPLVYILTDRAFRISGTTREELRLYMKSGGVLLLESARPGDAKVRDELRSLLDRIFEGEYDPDPSDWKLVLWKPRPKPPPVPPFEPIPRNHPLYHCFFDFDNGPPEGAGQELGAIPNQVMPYLESKGRGGRIMAIYSDRGYGLCWGAEGKYEEQMKMGVNLMLYCLIQQREKPGHRAILNR